MLTSRKIGKMTLTSKHDPAISLKLSSDTTHRWKFMRVLIADGNFKQEHLKMKYPDDDIALSNGHGYVVERKRFDAYIASAPPPPSQVIDLNPR